MTTSISNAPVAEEALARAEGDDRRPAERPAATPTDADAPARTLWGRFIVLVLCLAVVLSTLAFGTVHTWSLALFQAGAALVVVLWAVDAWRSRALRLSRNLLQLPLAGLILVGLAQLFLTGQSGADVPAGVLQSAEPVRSFSFDPYATRLVLVQLAALLIYFAAALTFVDAPARLRLVVRTLIVFGFVMALFGMMQSFVNPGEILWVRRPGQATPFGPYINRHHFAALMEMTLALPLGLLFAGAVERDRVPLYAFASAMMGLALVFTNSRGGLLSMIAEVFFLVVVAAVAGRGRKQRRGGEEEAAAEGEGRAARLRAAASRAGLGLAMILAILVGVVYFGGEESLSRFVGTVNSDDPTTGRAHFWARTVEIIQDHPVLGTGLGSFSAVYPRYDTRAGTYRLEQAHNDYLQLLSDAGIVGGVLGLIFVVALVRMALRRLGSADKFRRGVALGALTGCFAVLVHSFFDFTLHTTSNALVFLLLAALATINGRVEEEPKKRRRRRRRQSVPQPELPNALPGGGDGGGAPLAT